MRALNRRKPSPEPTARKKPVKEEQDQFFVQALVSNAMAFAKSSKVERDALRRRPARYAGLALHELYR